ncbi:protein of unknown function [Vibrio tapetis subsp. tapetis]|uniref:Uncharacterized protein n=1 Tax=Vibrio tapetis subsp. tapetis TaxID=1671868 RepID=A0A2N8ZI04_9VIBR|nr:protein of unknown function [Vibrio tapetis subsp. tapetis]
MGDVQHASQHRKATKFHYLEGKTSQINENPDYLSSCHSIFPDHDKGRYHRAAFRPLSVG